MNRFSLLIARRYLRSRRIWHSASIVVLMSASLTVLFIGLHSAVPTASQELDRDFGSFEHRLLVPLEIPPGERFDVPPSAEVRHSLTSLTNRSLYVPQLSPQAVFYKEMPWGTDSFLGRYVLTDGEWPERAREIVVMSAESDVVPGDRLSILDGSVTLTIVGVARDSFSDVPAIAAAPGTWESIPERLSEGFESLRATPVLYWDGAVPPMLRSLAEGASMPTEGSMSLLAEAVANRTDGTHHRSPVDRVPSGYLMPALVLPALGAILFVNSLNRWLIPQLDTLSNIGLSMPAVRGGVVWALVVAALCAVLVGALVGLVPAALAREVVATTTHSPGAPLTIAWQAVPSQLIIAPVAAAITFIAAARARLSVMSARRHVNAEWLRHGRHVLSAAMGCMAFWLATSPDTLSRIMMLAGALLSSAMLLAPEIINVSLKTISESGLRLRLLRRVMAADHRRISAAVALSIFMSGSATGLLILGQTSLTSAGASIYPAVAPGQLLLAGPYVNDLEEPSSVARSAVSEVLVEHTPIQLRYLRSGLSRGTSLRVELGTVAGYIIAVDEPRDVERALNVTLTSAQRDALLDGGALSWHGVSGEVDLTRVTSADESRFRLGVLDTVRVDVSPHGWRDGRSGVLLTRTAQSLKLPLKRGGLLYTGLAEAEVNEARHALAAAGIDPTTAQVFERPLAVGNELVMVAAALMALTIIVALATSVRTQVHTLRRYSGTLFLVGVPFTTIATVLVLLHLAIVGLGFMVGMGTSLIPLPLAAFHIPGVVVDVPWGQIATLLLAVLAGTVGATLIGLRGLQARESFTHH